MGEAWEQEVRATPSHAVNWEGDPHEKEEAFTLGFWLPGSILLWGKQTNFLLAESPEELDTALCPTAPGTEGVCVSMPGAECALLSSRSCQRSARAKGLGQLSTSLRPSIYSELQRET